MNTKQNPIVAIVGAGLSGLSLAFRLRQTSPDVSVIVLERDDRVGGNIHTEDHQTPAGNFRLEIGPNGFLDSKPSTLQLCQDLRIEDQLITASESARKNRFIFLDGKLRKLPGSLWSFILSPLLGVRGKILLATEKYRRTPPPPDQDESIHDFVTRRAGREAAEVFADALVTGIFGGDPKLLSVAACFPRLVQFERDYGSVVRGFSISAKQRRAEMSQKGETYQPQRLRSFRDGLRVLIEALRDQSGADLRTSTPVRAIERTGENRWRIVTEAGDISADVVVLTSPAYVQAAFLADLDAELARRLGEIEYNRIAVVAVGYHEKDVPKVPDGFGYIAPQRTGRDILGVQWCSAIYPDRAPTGMVLWRALAGGWHRGDVLDWDDARLLRAVRDELTLAHGLTASPTFSRIIRWHRAIPQYQIGHLGRIDMIKQMVTRHPGLFLGGNAFHGVAMNDCTEQGQILAEAVGRYLASHQTAAT